MNVRIRGIYATALTRLVSEAGHEIVGASEPIRERFDRAFGDGPADLAIRTTADRQGVGLHGEPDAVEGGRALLDIERDTFRWADPTPFGATYTGTVEDTNNGGATVSLGEGSGFLPFSESNGYIDRGDQVRVQVADPTPPWSDDDPGLTTTIRAPTPGGMAALIADANGIVDAPDDETAGLVELLSVEIPSGWGVELGPGARGADLADLETEIEAAADLAGELEGDSDDPTTPYASAWCWFGRESRFSLDGVRREVAPTMAGHHRIKAGSDSASDAVDFAEALCEPEQFPFDAVAGQFGPREGDDLAIDHGKPGGQVITLGRGEVIEYDPEGAVTVRREMSPGGTYDALGTPREAGDVAITALTEGRWWYPTVYKDEGGDRKGTYVNICTPVELFPDAARYIDLYVDVVKDADGQVERVDSEELDEAVTEGFVGEALAEKARSVAASIERGLS